MKRRAREAKTGVSRNTLFALNTLGSSDLKGVCGALWGAGAPETLTIGAVWNILERYRQLGLVQKIPVDGEYEGQSTGRAHHVYRLSAGGERRVRWLEKNL